ncbi:S8 family serine peptidase [Solitalea sp. MAHUQ-68]|uniref:S8 family serine peptidase n=1 Tax=Solitalea agri TaxID=2953739 RepID=A0A9X2F1V8_9SPHI|nr:S8 family serine peptidase [Solitalea agri]MCO4293132.1 S8 family serine peptidase [Solitalea agri]
MKIKFTLTQLFITIALLSFTSFIEGCSKKEEITGVATDLFQKIPKPSIDLSAKHQGDEIAGRYIVLFEDPSVTIESTNESLTYEQSTEKSIELARQLVAETGLKAAKVEMAFGSVLTGCVLSGISKSDLKMLEASKKVKMVESDKVIALKPMKIKKCHTASESVPWGVQRIGGSRNGKGKTAWVLDSGVDLGHTDLYVDKVLGKNFVDDGADEQDYFGHGTHVAGIIGAKRNHVGIVGVAAGAKIVPVRVLDFEGIGVLSWVIGAVNYVGAKAKKGEVANLSLVTPASKCLDCAVLRASSKGIKFVLAAGNTTEDANLYSPGRVNGSNIYTISACDQMDGLAWFSNYGNPPIDFAAPGVDIPSTYLNGGYATLSGTSMAAPHVAGILLLGSVKANGVVSNDVDGEPDKIAHW